MEHLFKGLYQIGKELLQLKWWEISDFSASILISDPHNIGYCTFLGNNKEEAEITIYRSYEGVISCLDLKDKRSQGYSEGSVELKKSLYRQEALQFTLEALEPAFYCLNPGQFPKEIKNLEDIQYLTTILRHLFEIFMDIKIGNLVLVNKKCLHVMRSKHSWTYELISESDILGNIPGHPISYRYQNDLKIHRLKKLKKINVTLEGIQFFAPPQIWDHELQQELLPMVTTFVSCTTGEIFFSDLSSYKPSNLEKLSDKLADTFLSYGLIPNKIVVEDEMFKKIIIDFCNQLEIKCKCGLIPTAKHYRNVILGQ